MYESSEGGKYISRFGIKRKSTDPIYEKGKGQGESSFISPPKYTPPASTSQEIASESIFRVGSRKSTFMKKDQPTKDYDSISSKPSPSQTQDEDTERHIVTRVPIGE